MRWASCPAGEEASLCWNFMEHPVLSIAKPAKPNYSRLDIHRKRVMSASQENGFMTAEPFTWWASEVPFPYIIETGDKTHHSGHGVIILDSCTSHGGDCFLDECTHGGIEIFFRPADLSDQAQPLDLEMFTVEKDEAVRTKIIRAWTLKRDRS
jgi:hypothetical protein